MRGSPPGGLSLVWHDEFFRWNDQWSTRATAFTDSTPCSRAHASCARVVDGEMVLSVREDPENPGKYLTGHVGATREFSPYGYFEAKVKFPGVFGVLSGWWLQTTEDYIPGQAEIDIAECGGRSMIHHTIWYRLPGMGAGEFVDPPPHIASDVVKGFQTGYHRYGVLWEPTGYTFFIDRIPVGTLMSGLSDRPKFPVLSMKIPKYMQDDFDPAHIREQKMRIKWIRVWQ